MRSPDRRIDDIRVLQRYRKDLGNIDELARSIDEIGLLHPVVVTPAGILIAGFRRLEACRLLGHDKIAVTVIDIDGIARGEAAENFVRKDFTLSEAVAIKRALEPAIKQAAKARMKAGKPSSKLDKGRADEKAALFTGRKRTTLAKAEAVVAAAEAEPERFGKLVADMDRTGRAGGVFNRLQVARQAEAIRRERPPLPGNGRRYRLIEIDPPWPYGSERDPETWRAGSPYPEMSLDEIVALDVASIAHEHCILWLWTTNAFMRAAYDVLDAWGFTPKSILTWGKDHFGNGSWLRGQTEHCIMAVRGHAIVQLTNQSTLLLAPAGRHSEKPAAFYALVESLCPAPRALSMFHRGPLRPNWDGHGDEVEQPDDEP